MNTDTDNKRPDFDGGFWGIIAFVVISAAIAFYLAFRTPESEIRSQHRDAVLKTRLGAPAVIVSCPICRKKVSSAAEKCPHCGNPQ